MHTFCIEGIRTDLLQRSFFLLLFVRVFVYRTINIEKIKSMLENKIENKMMLLLSMKYISFSGLSNSIETNKIKTIRYCTLN